MLQIAWPNHHFSAVLEHYCTVYLDSIEALRQANTCQWGSLLVLGKPMGLKFHFGFMNCLLTVLWIGLW